MTSSDSHSSRPAAALSTSKSSSKNSNLSISPYSISVYSRTKDAFADVHNEELPSTDLPDHHVPTLASNVKRAAWSSAPKKSKDKVKEKRDKVIQKVTIGFGSTKNKDGDGLGGGPTPSQILTKKAQSVLPLLTFQNPWDSYKAPGIWDMLNGGLQWGLPEDYFEGNGKGKYKGGGKHFLKRIQEEMDEAEKDGLRKGWERIEIRKPDWGIDEKKEDQEVGQGFQEGFAKATWLGHATTLLQLPSISPDDQALEETVEKKQEVGEDQESKTGGKGKKEVIEDKRKVEDVRKRSVNILFDPIFSER